MHQIGIVGASGYGGSELLRLLHGHPSIEAAVIAAGRQAGQPVASLFPNLAGDRVFDAIDVDQLGELDLVFLAAPHGVALDLAPELLDRGTRVIDFSGAFRLDPDEFKQWYGEDHPVPALAPAVYGLPEFFRDQVVTADLVANPGCYTTTSLLALRPLADLVVPGTVSVSAMSGLSGGGRGAKDALHFAHAHADAVGYGFPTHRHTGEIERYAGDVGALTFVPHLVPMARGILADVTATLRPGATQQDVDAALAAAYDNETFIHVLPAGTFPHVKSVTGSNGVQLSATVDPRTNRVVASAASDNLGKGAAGQALQNANLMLGLDEALGLTSVGMYP